MGLRGDLEAEAFGSRQVGYVTVARVVLDCDRNALSNRAL
jgi:hypothetical protein